MNYWKGLQAKKVSVAHRDASISIQVSSTCSGCGTDLGMWTDERELPLAEALLDPLLDRMRRGVYVEAQAAFRRGELRS